MYVQKRVLTWFTLYDDDGDTSCDLILFFARKRKKKKKSTVCVDRQIVRVVLLYLLSLFPLIAPIVIPFFVCAGSIT